MQCDAQKADEKVSDGLDVAVCATSSYVFELKCSFKNVMRVKSHKNMINFV